MKAPLFSVVIPTYNRADLVRQAAASVVHQSLDDIEVVVSDNLSTDDTRDVVHALDDRRVRYVRPPRHMVLPDHWEFARAQASGRLVMMLSDDDALLPRALASFVAEHRARDADFLFCPQAEYRDRAFETSLANTLTVPAYKDRVAIVDPAVFVGRQMSFRPKYNMHPSGFVFERSLAEAVAARNSGRFFQTLGVEYFAWPVAAVLARRIVQIDVPLVIIGRTAKSWGTNMVLLNPGDGKVDQLVADARTERRHTPLTNFTLANLILEGLLTAHAQFPAELEPYPVDMGAFVRATRSELERRGEQGLDVSDALHELDEYVARNPELARAGREQDHDPPHSWALRAKEVAGKLRARVSSSSSGSLHPAFELEGDRCGFHDALGAAATLAAMLDQR